MAINETCEENYGLVVVDGASKFSSDQIAYYCPLFADYHKYERSIYFSLGLCMTVTGAVGLVNNVLTFLTFSNGSVFAGPTFLYHKAMTIVELLHLAIMLQYGVLRAMHFPGGNTYWMVLWRDYAWGGWIIGNAAKMTVNNLIMFVSFERMMAVSFPFKFDKINRNGVAISAIALSILVGCLNLPSFAACHVILRGNDYVNDVLEFGKSDAYAAIQHVISVIKLWSGGVTFALCALVALGMYRSNMRAKQMSSDAAARWQAMKMACYLQLMLGITTVITHVAFVWYQILVQRVPFPSTGRLALLLSDSFEQALVDLPRSRYLISVEMANAVFTSLDHGGRFFFYLAFHATFRATFKNDVWNRFRGTKVHSLNTKH